VPSAARAEVRRSILNRGMGSMYGSFIVADDSCRMDDNNRLEHGHHAPAVPPCLRYR
jgi:hypothetical protein